MSLCSRYRYMIFIKTILVLTAAAAQFKLELFGGACTESSNLTKILSLAVYQFLNRISLMVSG